MIWILKKLVKKVFYLWVKYCRAVFIVVLLVACGAVIYLFYKNLYEDRWSQEDEIQYINSQRQNVNFREDKFKEVMEEIERKERVHKSEFRSVNDIFKPLEDLPQ